VIFIEPHEDLERQVERRERRCLHDGRARLRATEDHELRVAHLEAHKANDEGTSLRAAALSLGVSAADFDRIVRSFTRPNHAGPRGQASA
jgi:hypothetical protein